MHAVTDNGINADERRKVLVAISTERLEATLADRGIDRRRTLRPLCAARGFTLIELCVTLVVWAILSSRAAASMKSTFSKNRVYAAQDEFSAYVAFARSEAVRRGVSVVVGASAPVTGNAFGGGWTIWVDDNGDGAYDAGETLLRTHEALPSNIIVGDGTTNTIAFTPMGFLVPAATVDVKVCPADPALGGFDITIQPNGLTDVRDVMGHATPCN